jgi:hypothetical protein
VRGKSWQCCFEKEHNFGGKNPYFRRDITAQPNTIEVISRSGDVSGACNITLDLPFCDGIQYKIM